MNNLTEKQKRFCDEYLIDLNATRAYKAVYKNCKKDESARVNGSKLLTNTNIKNYIESQLEQMRSEKIADAEEVLKYLTSVMRGESLAEIVVTEWEGDGISNAVKMKKNPDEKERLKAAELLGKRFGLFKENVEVKGNIPIVISGGEELED
ncbi:MAG: terminase small subunit [Clostridia bacterium]|nr:terminase small subunit [Clostridia bacterium]